MYAYCLFCETGKCDRVAEELRALLDCRVLVPKQVQHTFSQGRELNIARDLLPGYVFVYSAVPVNMSVCWSVPGVVRCLKSGEAAYELAGGDYAFALFLLEKGGVLGKTWVTEKAGRLEVAPFAFRGAEAGILRVDRRNSRMQIEIRFLRRVIRTWVEYEIAESDTEQPGPGC